MHCLYCNAPLAGASRAAFDPWLGRLWRVCGACRRWNVVPLEERWETLEGYERAAREGQSRLRTEHLDLVRSPMGELIRVGRAPRPELAVWRYSDLAPPVDVGLLARLRRLLLGLPSSPFGYDAGYGAILSDNRMTDRWFASPFIDHAPTLTAAFLHVPLAPACPACGDPLAVDPWAFQSVRLAQEGGEPVVAARCGLCGDEVGVPGMAVRPALRLGLSIVNRPFKARGTIQLAAERLERASGPEGLMLRLGRDQASLGDLSVEDRLALGLALDEQAEAELLETEWREAEELATVVDGELTEVEGFHEFRQRVLHS